MQQAKARLISLFRRGARSHSSICVLTLLAVVLTTVSVSLGGYGLGTMLRSVALIAIAALGESVVLNTGGIDLSIHAVYSFSGLICTIMVNGWGASTPVAIVLGLLVCTCLGAVNGFVITRLSLSPYLVTLCTLGIINGFCKLLYAQFPILYLPADFTVLGQGRLLGLPIPFLICLVLLAGVHVLFSRTMLGRWMRAVRSDEWSAQMAGINSSLVKMISYAVCGFLVGLSGILEAARVGFSWPSTESMLMLGILAAARTGLHQIQDSRWKVPGVLLGSLVIVSLRQCLVLFQLLTWEDIFMGCILLLILALDRPRRVSG